MAEATGAGRPGEYRKFYSDVRQRLIDLAAAEARLGRRQDDGRTLAEHLQAVVKATGQVPDELMLPDVPAATGMVLSAWRDMSAARGGGFGPEPIGWPDMAGWQSATGIQLSPWEIETLRAMDSAALAGYTTKG